MTTFQGFLILPGSNEEHYDNLAALSKPVLAPQFGLGEGSPRRMGMVKNKLQPAKKPARREEPKARVEEPQVRRDELPLWAQAKRENENIRLVKVEYRRSRVVQPLNTPNVSS